MQLSSRIGMIVLCLFVSMPMGAVLPTDKEQAEMLKKLKRRQYLYTTGIRAFQRGVDTLQVAGEADVPNKLIPFMVTKNIASGLANDTLTDLANTGIARVLNLKKENHKDVLSWGVDFAKNGAFYRMSLEKNETKHWFRTYFFKIFLPSFMMQQVVNLTHSAFVKTTGISYPHWVKQNLDIYALVDAGTTIVSKTLLSLGISFILSLAAHGDTLLQHKKSIQTRGS